ncbi:MAG: hypothetical protein ACRELD_05260 [Longimicrobiales bacterium]
MRPDRRRSYRRPRTPTAGRDRHPSRTARTARRRPYRFGVYERSAAFAEDERIIPAYPRQRVELVRE